MEVRRGVEVMPAGPDGRAASAVTERGVVRRLVDDRREDRRRDDADDQVAAEADRPQREREHEAEDGDEDRPGGEAAELDRRAAARLRRDDPRVVEPDERDEEADADRDRLLQFERDRLED